MENIKTAISSALAFGISKLHSRKFVVWGVATIGLFTHFVSNDQWLMISMMFLGVQGALDWRSNGTQSAPAGETK